MSLLRIDAELGTYLNDGLEDDLDDNKFPRSMGVIVWGVVLLVTSAIGSLSYFMSQSLEAEIQRTCLDQDKMPTEFSERCLEKAPKQSNNGK